MKTALALQATTFSRSLTARITTVLMVAFPPLFGIGMVAVARSGAATGPSAAKFAPYAEGPLGEAVAGLAGVVLMVVTLIAAGFAVAWLFGREWADGTYGSLFALTVSRREIAAAKLIALGAWATVCVTLAALLTAAGTAIAAPEGLTSAAIAALLRMWIAALIMVSLSLPFGWVAVRFKGYLAAIGALIGATAASQILASFGAAAWVPYVAPALWAGSGGADATLAVGLPHLAIAVAFAAFGTWASVRAFARARLD